MLFAFCSFSMISCKVGEGCQAEEKVHTKLDRNGNPKKKPKSGLFPKKAKRRS